MNGRAMIVAPLIAAAIATAGSAQAPKVTEQVSGSTALLQAISPVSANVVWTSGHSGAVLRTLDGGDHWQTFPIDGTAQLEFRAIQASSANDAWVMSAGNGAASRIYHTADGGAHWALQFSNTDSAAFYDCLTFFDAKHGVAFSDAAHGRTTILRTEDGGEHWALLPESSVPAAVKGEGAFAASGGCAVHSDARHGWIATGSPAARIFGTTNAGKTWQLVAATTPVVHDSNSGWTGVSFIDAKRGIGVAGRIDAHYNRDTSSAAVATTVDGGKTWTLRHRPTQPGALFGVIAAPAAGAEVAVGASLSGLMLTTNNGDTWSPLTTSSYWSVGAFGKRAWGVGPRGRITRIDF